MFEKKGEYFGNEKHLISSDAAFRSEIRNPLQQLTCKIDPTECSRIVSD
jgi:hypothetical protein